MKIGITIHELVNEGGGERQCMALARGLRRLGHDVTLYTSVYDPHCFAEIGREIKVVEVGRGALSGLPLPLFARGYFDMRRMATAVREHQDIWNPHHWPAQWGAVWLKRKLGGQVVWMCNDVPNLLPLARQQHGMTRFFHRLVYTLFYRYDRARNRGVDLTMFLSRWAESEFLKLYEAPTCIVRSGADPERFRPGGDREGIRRRLGYTEKDFVVLWLGILMPHRRLEDAISAIALLAARKVDVKLVLAGSEKQFAGYARALHEQVSKLRVGDNVCFPGKVADEEIRDFYCACDAFLFPNENQTWGLAVLEAMACGRPVLVSQGAAIHEILTDGRDALLFPARAPEALADCIERLVRDPQLRVALGDAGVQAIRTTYNWDGFARRVAEVFAGVQKAPSDRPRSELLASS